MISLTLSLLPALALAPSTGATTTGATPSRTIWFDVDSDGLQDLYLTKAGAEDRLLINAGDGTFSDVTAVAGLGGQSGTRAALWHDANGDRRSDLLLVRRDGSVRLFLGAEGRTWVDGTRGAGLEVIEGVLRAEWVDYDRDGVTDLLLESEVGVRLLHGEAGGAFRELTTSSFDPAPAPDGRAVTGIGEGAVLGSEGERDGDSSSVRPESGRAGAADHGGLATDGAASLPATLGTGDQTHLGGATAADATQLPSCPDTLVDQATGACGLMASSVPTLGMLYPLSADWFVDAATHFVGIGNLNPTTPLDVEGVIRSRTGGIQFPDGSLQTTATLQGPPGADGVDGVDGQDGSDALWETNGSDMHYPGGNIGIGTDTPAAALHVLGDLRADRGGTVNGVTGTLTLGGARIGSTSPFAEIDFASFDNDSAQTDYVGARIRAFNPLAADSGDLRFFTNDSSGLGERMRITPSGDIGIGEAAPAARLDVDGTIRSQSGGFEFPDGSVQATASLGMPSGFQLLGPSETPPSGFSYSGLTISSDHPATWGTRGSGAAGRYNASSVVFDGLIYLFGGFDGSSRLADIDAYDPQTEQWTSVGSLPGGVESLACAERNGFLIITGGSTGSGVVNVCGVLNPVTGVTGPFATMAFARESHALSSIDGDLYATGGFNAVALPHFEKYDSGAGSWSLQGALPNGPRYEHSSEVIDGKLYLIGGRNSSGNAVADLYEFDPVAGTWSARASLPQPRGSHGSAVLDGRIYVFGGVDGGGVQRGDTFCYDPSTNSWTTLETSLGFRARVAGASLDGRVHCVGGTSGGSVVSQNRDLIPPKTLYVHTAD